MKAWAYIIITIIGIMLTGLGAFGVLGYVFVGSLSLTPMDFSGMLKFVVALAIGLGCMVWSTLHENDEMSIKVLGRKINL